MTAQEGVLDLLRYVGVTGFTDPENDQALNRPGLDNDDIRRAISAFNSALQTIQTHGPQDLKDGEKSAFFESPASVHLSVVLNGRAAVASVTPPAWMLGCSILIDGDSDINRIEDISDDEFALVRGYRGLTNANVLATVYGDCALLMEDIGAVIEPVSGFPNLKLRHAPDLETFNNYTKRWVPGTEITEGSSNKQPGVPAWYYVERRRSGELFMRVTPMPAVGFNATFRAKLRAEHIDGDVLDLTGASDPGYEFSSLHAGQVDSLLLPIARWRFFTHPALKNAETRQTVKTEYDEVMLALKNGTVFEVSVHDTRADYR